MTKFIILKNEIIAIDKYAGKNVKAKAKCNPSDVFDEEFGKRLAEERLNNKIIRLKMSRIENKIKEDDLYIDYLISKTNHLEDYRFYCSKKLNESYKRLREMEM